MGEGAQDEERGPRAARPQRAAPGTQSPEGLSFLQGPAGAGGGGELAIGAPLPARFSVPAPKPPEAVLPFPTTQGPCYSGPPIGALGLECSWVQIQVSVHV